jgi:hypothetical protein
MQYTSINLLGPYNSGTNLVNNILKLHFKTDTDGTNHVWKHSICLQNIEQVIKNNKNTLFVVCYRPLYSWIKSMEKEQYDIKWNKQMDGIVEFQKCKYNNITELYIKYYNMYQNLINKYNNIIKLEYYKICDVNISFNYISEKLKPFNIVLSDIDKYNNILNNPSKIHGKPVKNSDDAMKKKKYV